MVYSNIILKLHILDFTIIEYLIIRIICIQYCGLSIGSFLHTIFLFSFIIEV